jgi:hypothetical protein
VPAPNSSAAPRAAAAPRRLKLSCKFNVPPGVKVMVKDSRCVDHLPLLFERLGKTIVAMKMIYRKIFLIL